MSDSTSAKPELQRHAQPTLYAASESQRGFWALIATQFQGAFSDNVLRYLLLGIVVGTGISEDSGNRLVSVIMLLFSLPFILFSMSGGYLADRYSKRSVAIGTKFMEIGCMLIATVGLALHSLPIALIGLALVATQAALFGPSKYGLLPELLPEKRLSWGNGVIELGTFLAIITGTVIGGVMADRFHGHEVYAGYILLTLACLGVVASLGINRVPAASPGKIFRPNFIGDLGTNIRLMLRDRPLFLAVLGNTYFWFMGALLMSTVLVYGKYVLHVSTEKSAYLNAALAIGIGLGSLTAGYLSANKIEYGLIPLGSIGITEQQRLRFQQPQRIQPGGPAVDQLRHSVDDPQIAADMDQVLTISLVPRPFAAGLWIGESRSREAWMAVLKKLRFSVLHSLGHVLGELPNLFCSHPGIGGRDFRSPPRECFVVVSPVRSSIVTHSFRASRLPLRNQNIVPQ